MFDTWYLLSFVGGLFLMSMLVGHIADRLAVPRVTMLILSGIAIGPWGADLVNGLEQSWFPIITEVTLLLIGYLLGSKITRRFVISSGKAITLVTISLTIFTFLAVFVGLLLFDIAVELAAVFAAIAVATDPTATLDVLEQNKKQVTNQQQNLVRGVVALDDVVALLVFSIVLAAVSFISPQQSNSLTALATGFLTEVGGSVLLGLLLGLLLSYLLNNKRHPYPVFIESIGVILLCGGLASYFHMSSLLAAMTMGIVVINLTNKKRMHLHDIEMAEQPLLILFFILAGASLNFATIITTGWLIAAYVVFRLGGRFIAGYIISNSYLSGFSKPRLGLTFTSQAGVAMGMALVAANQLPNYSATILSTTIAATVIFELAGPLLTKWSLNIKNAR